MSLESQNAAPAGNAGPSGGSRQVTRGLGIGRV
jgi:hypothetical protein